MLLTGSLGFMVGIPLGLLIHRGEFCMHSGFRKILRGEQSSSFLAFLLALGLQMVFVNALAATQLFIIPVPPFTWLAATVGGVIFGFGMIWAKG